MMRAAVRDRYGPPEVVGIRELDRPEPTGDEVLIRVQAASINRADLDLIRPKPAFTRLFMGLRRPKERRVGCDVAGVVEGIGPDVTRFQPGDRVFGDLYPFGLGGFAEFACAPESGVQPVPDSMPIEVAATLPHAAVLAVQGLRRRDGRTIGRGDRVLIDGGSGSVGPFAIQVAKAHGAEVSATCGPAKMDLVRDLGADHVIDYTTTDVTRSGQRYDWILDVDSHHPIRAWRRALARGGTYVTLGGSTRRILAALILGPILSRTGDRSMGLLLWWSPFHADDVARLLELAGSGAVRPVIDRTYPLEEVVQALRYVDDGLARGKVVIVPRHDTDTDRG